MSKKIVPVKQKIVNPKNLPPPPGRKASWEEQAEYFEKYDWDDLRRAGYLRPLTKKEEAEQAQLERAIRTHLAMRRKKVS
jgi:hypothetical protein